MNGRIFDIRRFSTHDGAGIRTTVFFKGCPLRCRWCQNPEGISADRRPIWFDSQCVRCGACVRAGHGGLHFEDDRLILDPSSDENWELLIEDCPSGALAMDSRDWKTGELIREIEKDAVFFRHGGGVTLSGGEPLMQGDFAVELLKELKKQGIDTAIETSLSVPLENVQAAAPYLDTIYADLKIFDNEAHIKAAGRSNTQIRANIRWLLTSEHRDKVIIRTPLIPEFTADEENIGNIARFITSAYPEVRYELLNYNPLAEAKYRLVGRSYCFEDNPSPYSEDTCRHFARVAAENGVKNLITENMENIK